MRQIFILIFCSMSVFALSAQNPMFCGFDTQYEGVYQWLEGNHAAQIVSEETNRLIVVQHNQAILTYRFNLGRLYEIDMRKTYASKKQGKDAYDGCMDYFKMVARRGVEFQSGKGRSCQITEKSGKLYDLELVRSNESEDVYILQLTSKDPRLMPISEQSSSDSRYKLDENQTYEYLQLELAKQELFRFF